MASNLLHMVAKKMKVHYSKKADKLMSVEECERLAREAAQAEGAKCVAEEPAEEACCSTGTCGDSLPGETKERSVEETVKAASGEGCGDSCGCE
mgnify:FL=1